MVSLFVCVFVSLGECILGIDLFEGFLWGYGMWLIVEDNGIDGDGDDDCGLVVMIVGVVECVNKFVLVWVLKVCYVLEMGDVVFGRVKEIFGKCWILDVNVW